MTRRPALALALMLGLAAATADCPARAQTDAPPPGGQPPAGGQGGDSLGADWGQQQNQARQAVRSGRYLPLTRIIAEISRRDRGHELDAGIEALNGRPVYRVRWASADGRRIDYIVDAQSGAILSAQ